MTRTVFVLDDVPGTVRRAQAGDGDAIADLFRAYRPLVLGVIRKRIRCMPTAEDLTSETFLRMLSRLDTYRPEHGAQFSSWLCTIARNLTTDWWRKEIQLPQPGSVCDVSGAVTIADPAVGPAEAVVGAEHCRWSMAQLPPRHAAVISARYIDDRSAYETAALLGIPYGTVKSRSHHAGLRLARLLTDMETR